jgi:hypothetical protein
MNEPTVTFEDVKRFLANLPQADQKAVQELLSHFLQNLKQANPVVASIALCLATDLFLSGTQAASVQKLPQSPTPTHDPNATTPMKNDFAFIRAPTAHGAPFFIVTPHSDRQTRTPNPKTHPITRLEAESLLEEMIQTLGGWIRESKACQCPQDKSCHT